MTAVTEALGRGGLRLGVDLDWGAVRWTKIGDDCCGRGPEYRWIKIGGGEPSDLRRRHSGRDVWARLESTAHGWVGRAWNTRSSRDLDLGPG